MSPPLLGVVACLIVLAAINGETIVVVVAALAALAICELVLAALGAL